MKLITFEKLKVLIQLVKADFKKINEKIPDGTTADNKLVNRSDVKTALSSVHTHSNKDVLDGFAETDGVLQHNGKSYPDKAYVDDSISTVKTNLESEASTRLSGDTALESRISTNEMAITTLNGTGEGSVSKTVADKIAEIVSDAPEDLDTLKEISDWISGHESDASAMNTAIQTNKTSIETNASDIVALKTADSELSKKIDDAVSQEITDRTTADSELSKKIDDAVSPTRIITAAGATINGNLTVTGSIVGTADIATKLGTENKGSSTKPIYLMGGVPYACEELDHNVPRLKPKDITSYYQDGSLWDRIAGEGGYSLFEDIFVGDYFQMNNTSAAKTGTGAGIQCPGENSSYTTNGSDCSWVMIAGIDTLMGNGDQNDGVDYHHLVMVPGGGENYEKNQFFGRHRMNSSDTTANGYHGSEMFSSVLGAVVTSGSTASGATINQQLYAEFGTHLKTTRELLSTSINTSGCNRFGTNSGTNGGCANKWGWYDCQAVLMSEVEVYGSIVFSSSGYDTGNANRQLPLFAFSKKAQNNRNGWYWLKDAASSSYFCFSNSSGYSDYNGASHAYLFVRPRFVIAK